MVERWNMGPGRNGLDFGGNPDIDPGPGILKLNICTNSTYMHDFRELVLPEAHISWQSSA